MRRSGLTIQNNDSGKAVTINTDIKQGPVLLGIMPAYLPLHIIPVNDTTPHTDMHFLDCACEPNLQLNGTQLVVVHNAYDGRP